MPPRGQTFHFESKQLRDLANREDVSFRFSLHAEERMLEYDVSRLDVQSVVRSGAVTDVQPDGRLRVQGRDRDGRDIGVVVAPEEERLVIVIVTVISTRKRG